MGFGAIGIEKILYLYGSTNHLLNEFLMKKWRDLLIKVISPIKYSSYNKA